MFACLLDDERVDDPCDGCYRIIRVPGEFSSYLFPVPRRIGNEMVQILLCGRHPRAAGDTAYGFPSRSSEKAFDIHFPPFTLPSSPERGEGRFADVFYQLVGWMTDSCCSLAAAVQTPSLSQQASVYFRGRFRFSPTPHRTAVYAIASGTLFITQQKSTNRKYSVIYRQSPCVVTVDRPGARRPERRP